MLDKFHEECGVVAVYGHPEASKLAYLGLYSLQHRGQESAGMAATRHAERAPAVAGVLVPALVHARRAGARGGEEEDVRREAYGAACGGAQAAGGVPNAHRLT